MAYSQQIIQIDLAYTSDYFNAQISQTPGFCLVKTLDETGKPIEILTAFPYKHYRLDDLAAIDELTDELIHLGQSISGEMNGLPFCGGAIGYIGYDVGPQTLGIHQAAHPAIHGLPLVQAGLYDSCIIIDHCRRRCTAVCLPLRPDSQARFDALLASWSEQRSSIGTFSLSVFEKQISRDAYRQGFDHIQKALRAGRCYQVNYTQPYLANYQGDPWAIYCKIAAGNPVPFGGFIRGADHDILSFSPERFLKIADRQVLTSLIKGTARRSPQPVLDALAASRLRLCPKNQAENVMIVDLMRNDLGQLAVAGTVDVTRLLALEHYPAVHHLVSDIRATLRDGISPFEALLSCFPGGSITGTPKREAMKVIAEVEPWRRGVYCGSIFTLSFDGRLESNIAIRTMTAHDQQMYLATGGAIVIDSNCEDEYQECDIKAAGIMRALI